MEDHPQLRTPRLLLRPFRNGDVDDVFAYATDPEWGRYLPLPDPYTRRSAEEFVARCILVDGETRFEWAIVHEGRVSGSVSLTVSRPGSAEMGYSIARPLWGRGLTTEAATGSHHPRLRGAWLGAHPGLRRTSATRARGG